MKLHITRKQLGELNARGKENLIRWVVDHKYTSPEIRKFSWYENNLLLSIGQMIEFLYEKEEGVNIDFFSELDGNIYGPLIYTNNNEISIQGSGCDIESFELCDVLWEACKEVLEILENLPSNKK